MTSDLGAGSYGLQTCETAGGDGGQLQNTPRQSGCTGPTDPWIAFDEKAGTLNVPGTPATTAGLIAAFRCIGDLGTNGCVFENQLEAARRALDPKRQVNPGFLRANAALLVLFLTDEDDCSAQKPELYDPSQNSLTGRLGPLTSFRCFEHGIKCDVNDRTESGTRKDCEPAYDWLYPIGDYITFFASLNRPLALASIAGPATQVSVAQTGEQMPILQSSCKSRASYAAPAIRIHALVKAFGGTTGSVCTETYEAYLKAAAKQLNP